MDARDRSAVTSKKRDQWELELRAQSEPRPEGRVRRFGRILDVLERIVGAGDVGRYR